MIKILKSEDLELLEKKLIKKNMLEIQKQMKKLVEKIKKHVFAFKIGYEFFLNFGLTGYKEIDNKKVKIFLDLKLHDIPNTVKNAVKAIAKLKPYFTTIHITGGDEMQKIAHINKKEVKILGVSILTSIDKKQSLKYYGNKNIENLVRNFVKYSIKNKLDGVVCSPLEIKIVKEIAGNKLDIVTPGIRPVNYKNVDDQKRFLTPKQAVTLGANYLVLGRPITKALDPLKEIISINKSIE